jgi:hypothetical protein
MTLYRFPLEELRERGLKEADVPLMKINHDNDPEFKAETIETFPEEVVFSIGDLKEFYSNFAMRDQRIKDFVERITEQVMT